LAVGMPKRCRKRIDGLAPIVTTIHINYILFTFLTGLVNENLKRPTCVKGFRKARKIDTIIKSLYLANVFLPHKKRRGIVRKRSVFKETYQYYLDRIDKIDLHNRSVKLGGHVEKGEMVVSFFGKPYRISSRGIRDPFGDQPLMGICVVLCKYLLLCPDVPSLDKEWVSFRDFKNTAPLIHSFVNHTERPIARHFSNRLQDLSAACEKLGGKNPGLELSYQLIMTLYPLPKVAVLLLFDDADEEFPAQCKVLFERRAEHYLDPESLAMVGALLYDVLKKDQSAKNQE
jgi:Domain of unknown function (DUF3786)